MIRTPAALLATTLVLAATACGRGAPPAAAPQGGGDGPATREALLSTCPAKAPSWFDDAPPPPGLAGESEQRRRLGLRDDLDYVRELHARESQGGGSWSRSWGFLMTQQEEAELWRRQERLQETAQTATAYLAELPPEQAGVVRLDQRRGAVVVQVTRDAERVQRELQERVGTAARVEAETVRYSQAELERVAQRILSLPGLNLSGVSHGGADGRVDVAVRRDLEQARRWIAAVADPCSFRVTLGDAGPVLDDRRGTPLTR